MAAAVLTCTPGCKKSKCESVTCLNGGVCDENSGQCSCGIASQYYGPNCQYKIPDCQFYNTALLTVVNNEPDAYTVSVTGFPDYTFNSGDSYTYPPFTPQTIYIRATQQNYTTLPKISHSSHTFAQCEGQQWSF